MPLWLFEAHIDSPSSTAVSAIATPQAPVPQLIDAPGVTTLPVANGGAPVSVTTSLAVARSDAAPVAAAAPASLEPTMSFHLPMSDADIDPAAWEAARPSNFPEIAQTPTAGDQRRAAVASTESLAAEPAAPIVAAEPPPKKARKTRVVWSNGAVIHGPEDTTEHYTSSTDAVNGVRGQLRKQNIIADVKYNGVDTPGRAYMLSGKCKTPLYVLSHTWLAWTWHLRTVLKYVALAPTSMRMNL